MIQKPRPCVAMTRSSPCTSMSRTEVMGRFCLQRLPVRAVVEARRTCRAPCPRRAAPAVTGSSRTTLTKASRGNARVDARPALAAVCACDRCTGRHRPGDAGRSRGTRRRGSKCDSSMPPTFDHGVSAGGVTSSQCAPASSSAPDQPIVRSDPERVGGERRGRDACRSRRGACSTWSSSAAVGASRFGGIPASGRVRSGLIGAQCSPPSAVRKRRWLAKYSVLLAALARTQAAASRHRGNESPGRRASDRRRASGPCASVELARPCRHR